MTPALTKQVIFDEFIDWLPENSEGRYELHHGVIVEMPKPTGKHSNVTGFLIEELVLNIIQIGKRGIWTIPRESIVKPKGESGYEPDIIVLDQEALSKEPRWERESIIENAASVKLIVEVVSTNWRDDYYKKCADYVRVASRREESEAIAKQGVAIAQDCPCRPWGLPYSALQYCRANKALPAPCLPSVLLPNTKIWFSASLITLSGIIL